jgi:hypothetical protein
MWGLDSPGQESIDSSAANGTPLRPSLAFQHGRRGEILSHFRMASISIPFARKSALLHISNHAEGNASTRLAKYRRRFKSRGVRCRAPSFLAQELCILLSALYQPGSGTARNIAPSLKRITTGEITLQNCSILEI